MASFNYGVAWYDHAGPASIILCPGVCACPQTGQNEIASIFGLVAAYGSCRQWRRERAGSRKAVGVIIFIDLRAGVGGDVSALRHRRRGVDLRTSPAR